MDKNIKNEKGEVIGTRPMVPHGTERARRRAGLVKGWRHTKGAARMLPPENAVKEDEEE